MRNLLRFSNPVRKLRARGDAARDARQWALAAGLYEAYLSEPSASRDAPIWVQLGHSRKESGDDEGAMRAYRRALELAPEVADTHLQIGHLQKKMGQVDLALTSFAEALRIDADSAHARREVSGLARDAAAVAGPHGVDRAEFLLARGDACRDGRRWSEAVENYATYLELRADDKEVWPIWVQMGHALRESGDRAGAMQAYERAAGLGPDSAEPRVHLGNLHEEMGDLDAASAAFAEVVRMEPDDQEGRLRLRRLVLRAASMLVQGQGFDGDDQVRLAFPPPRRREEVAFNPAFPPVYPGLSRRFGSSGS